MTICDFFYRVFEKYVEDNVKEAKDMKKANRKFKSQGNMKSLVFSLMIREINIKPKKRSLHTSDKQKHLLIFRTPKAVY